MFFNIVEYRYNAIQYNMTIDTPKWGDLWGVHCEEFGENWPRYNGTALYYDFKTKSFSFKISRDLDKKSILVSNTTASSLPIWILYNRNPYSWNWNRSPCWNVNVFNKVASLQWRHNGCDGVSNHQPNDCLLKRLFRRRSKKTSKLRVTGLYEGNSPETGEFPAQMASDAENVSIWWRHHEVSATHLKIRTRRVAQSSKELCDFILTHRGIFTSLNYPNIGSDNGLSPVRYQAISWTSAGLLFTNHFGSKVSEIWIKIQQFTDKKMTLKMSSWPFCFGVSVIRHTVNQESSPSNCHQGDIPY